MHNRRRNGGLRRGTSLVEVLVVLVILVLGIFSIARLFPGGFFTIRSAENNTFADRLGQAQLETLKQNSAFLLDAVYVYNDNTGLLDPNVNLADLNDDYPTGAVDASYNDINKARYVSGESFTVPAVGANGVPIHVLNYGPVHIPASALNGTVPTPYIPGSADPVGFSLFSAPWIAQSGSAEPSPSDLSQPVNGPNDLLQPGKPDYLVDYTNGQIAVPYAAYPQNFALVVKQVNSAGVAQTFTITFRVNASNASSNPYTGGWFAPSGTSNNFLSNVSVTPSTTGTTLTLNAPFVIGSAILTRPLTFISTGGASAQDTTTAYPNLLAQADPYTYELTVGASAVLNGADGDEYMGALAINPKLAGQQVSASYLVVDWHIIHEDDDVPAITDTFGAGTPVTNQPIRLTLNHLQRVGDVLTSQASPSSAQTTSVYNGLFTAPAGGAAPTPYDIVLLDTDTGQMQPLSATEVGGSGAISDSDNDTTAPLAGQFAVSYQNGRITLPATTVASVSPQTSAWASVPHRHLRVFYAGDYGWAVALQKNPSLYQVLSSPPTTLGVGQCYQDTNAPTHLVFPITDLGQSVEVDGITYTDTGGNTHQVSTASGAISTDFAGTNYVDLGPFLPNADTTKGPIMIGTVRGVSARSVVIWKERDQWKSRAVSTILNRS